MRVPALLAVAFALASAPAQTAADVGLTLQNGPLATTVTAVAGQVCGAFTCTPFPLLTPSTAASLVRTVRIYGDANSLFVLAMSTGPTAQPCVPIPGIANALILGQPMAVVAFGVTGPFLPTPSIACQQGVATLQLQLPPVSPAVIPFVLQALTFSHATQGPAFTVAVQGFAY
jgi:hypothetical protein